MVASLLPRPLPLSRSWRQREAELVDSKTLAELPAELKEQIERQCHKILNILK